MANTIAKNVMGGGVSLSTAARPGLSLAAGLEIRPDGALMHIAREYAKIHSRILVPNELPDDAEKAMDDVLTRQHALMDIMIATPAESARSWRAKAEVLAIAIEEDNSTFDPEVRLAAALAKDLMQGIAPPK